ncbi:hypothetical protein ASC97_07625 [Rhizobium sp. Root1203]|uniref:hypothetical protein n=1 Tax=Rhizobium sp. Root1203 TaxID=1736427 RepID=UPI000713B6FC|nr:hypothetical protein [Rhizobium sp. Root1203]KQV28200.1 hypothetical protein ASC97_07625 [Rhizobium sp. Root1203]
MSDHNVHCGSGDPVPHILGRWLLPFRPWFTAPSWEHLLALVMGAILCPGKRTVTACLRITGRADADNFSLYHQLSFMRHGEEFVIHRFATKAGAGAFMAKYGGEWLDPNDRNESQR